MAPDARFAVRQVDLGVIPKGGHRVESYLHVVHLRRDTLKGKQRYGLLMLFVERGPAILGSRLQHGR